MTRGPGEQHAGRRPIGGPAGTDQGDRYPLVFGLLVLSYLLSALLTDSRVRAISLILYLAALLLAIRSARLPVATARRLRWGLSLRSVTAGALALLGDGRVTDGLVALWLAAMLALTVGVVVRRVLSHEVVTLQTIFGALSAYLLIGFTFAALFTAAAYFDSRPFFAGGQPANSNTVQYFSFVTLTTTGYGDLAAASDWGRTLAVMDALLGQIFLVTLVARLVAVFGTARRRADGVGSEVPARADRTRQEGSHGDE